MNYTAHLFLSRNYPSAVLGNYLTDMMTIEETRRWPEMMQTGVELHHYIDNFTDKHPCNFQMRRDLRPYFRKYAGVALDIYYDFILYQNWKSYTDQSFEDFEMDQYEIILNHRNFIPDRLTYTVNQMIKGRFLHRFTTLRGQSHAFANMNHRASFETGFEKAIEVLESHQEKLTGSFNEFFPDMIRAVDKFQANQPSK